jgi:hypothetical protein
LTYVVLVLLAAVWAAVLLPPLLRSRSERQNDSIGDFNYRLDVLGKTNGQLRPGVPTRMTGAQRAARRRRDVMRVLLASLLLTGLLALATNAQLAWLLLGVAAAAFAGFCGLWAYARALQAERTAKVRPLGAPQLRRRAPDYELQRAASS